MLFYSGLEFLLAPSGKAQSEQEFKLSYGYGVKRVKFAPMISNMIWFAIVALYVVSAAAFYTVAAKTAKPEFELSLVEAVVDSDEIRHAA